MSSQGVVAVEHLDEGLILVVIILLQIFDVVDLTRSILNLKEVGVHGFGGELVQCRGCVGRWAPRVCRFTDWSGHPAR